MNTETSAKALEVESTETDVASSIQIKPKKKAKPHRGPHTYRETKESSYAGLGEVFWVADDNPEIKISAKPYQHNNN